MIQNGILTCLGNPPDLVLSAACAYGYGRSAIIGKWNVQRTETRRSPFARRLTGDRIGTRVQPRRCSNENDQCGRMDDCLLAWTARRNADHRLCGLAGASQTIAGDNSAWVEGMAFSHNRKLNKPRIHLRIQIDLHRECRCDLCHRSVHGSGSWMVAPSRGI